MATSIEVVSAIRSLAKDLGMNTDLADLKPGLYRRADAAGCAEMDNAALIKMFTGDC